MGVPSLADVLAKIMTPLRRRATRSLLTGSVANLGQRAAGTAPGWVEGEQRLPSGRLPKTRMTNDVDVIPAPDRQNLIKLAEALRALDARVLNPGHEDLQVDAAMLPRATIWQLATPHGNIDVLHKAPGAASYPELRKRALVIALDDVRVPVAGRDDLIRMKLARNRPIDRADVAALTDPEAG